MAKILVVGPHPDDQEAGMGATIAKLSSQGHDVLLLDMTNGEPTPLGDPVTRHAEAARAAEILGVQRRMLEMPGVPRGYTGEGAMGGTGGMGGAGEADAWGAHALPNRWIEYSVEARKAVASVIREHRAQIIFVPFFEDAHPDHKATTRIVEDARFDAKLTKAGLPGDPIYPRWLFYYYATHLRWVANPTFCLDVTGYEDKKIASMEAYHTQFVAPGRIGAQPKGRDVRDWVMHSLGYFGTRIATMYAEPFFTKEPLGLSSLDGLAL